ncbi:phosphotransferase [Saccharopolyspora shandongensis]|uniref:phosphotransferase enzyme family protein n=1 Tax=Saccharopolyspora shandongensis TaxID=418495 RepID=UPI0033F816FB
MARPFESLARSSQLKRLRELAFPTLERHGVETRGIRLVQYEDNAVFLVDAGSAKYVLRMSVRHGRSPQEQRSELAWLAALASEKAVLVPKSAGEGWVITQALGGWPEPVTSVVFEWIPGTTAPSYSSPGVAEQLGRLTASLHDHAHRYRPPAEFARPSWNFDDVFTGGAALADPKARARLDRAELDLLGRVSAMVRDRMPDRTAADWGLSHADLHRGNLVRTPGGDTAVIDFDDCGWGYYALDIATVLSSVLRVCDARSYGRFAAGYLGGYRAVRELPPAMARFDEFLVMRDVIILNFVLSSANEAVLSWGPGRAKGIFELMRAYAETGEYAGHLDVNGMSRTAPA